MSKSGWITEKNCSLYILLIHLFLHSLNLKIVIQKLAIRWNKFTVMINFKNTYECLNFNFIKIRKKILLEHSIEFFFFFKFKNTFQTNLCNPSSNVSWWEYGIQSNGWFVHETIKVIRKDLLLALVSLMKIGHERWLITRSEQTRSLKRASS